MKQVRTLEDRPADTLLASDLPDLVDPPRLTRVKLLTDCVLLIVASDSPLLLLLTAPADLVFLI